MNIKAIIFDMDGVLIDAKKLHRDAFIAALEEIGCYVLGKEEHDSAFCGLPTRTKLNMLTERYGLPAELHDYISELKQKMTHEIAKDSISFDQEKFDLLVACRDAGCRLVCCSNSIHYTIEQFLQLAGIRDLFEFVVGNDCGLSPKPDPAMYVYAIQRLGVEPENVVIVEDSPHGIKAAHAAEPGLVIEVPGFDAVTVKLFQRHGLIP